MKIFRFLLVLSLSFPLLSMPAFASEDAAFVTGQVLSVSGGLTMNG